jgi:hypothetical protein
MHNGGYIELGTENRSANFINMEWVVEYVNHILRMEQEIIDDAVSNCNEDDVFFDVGAGVGVWSCLLGNELTNGEVVGFEPNLARHPYLKNHSKKNNINMRIRTTPVGEGKDTVSLSGEKVTMRRLDTFINSDEIQDPDIVKIDIEGAELSAIKGMTKILENKNCQYIYCELHTQDLEGEREHGKLVSDEVREMREILNSHGYEVDDVTTPTSPSYLRGSKI